MIARCFIWFSDYDLWSKKNQQLPGKNSCLKYNYFPVCCSVFAGISRQRLK